MMEASTYTRRQNWNGETRDSITLPSETRYRRRIVLKSDNGREFLLNLDRAVLLQHGDVLVVDDGFTIMIKAADEPLLEITAPSPTALLTLAWHIGNRHLQAQIEQSRILIHPDHVIEKMVQDLGASTRHVEEPFDPEGGAYDTHTGHAHSHE